MVFPQCPPHFGVDDIVKMLKVTLNTLELDFTRHMLCVCCLLFYFGVQWVEVLFVLLILWNCWPSLFKLSFHNNPLYKVTYTLPHTGSLARHISTEGSIVNLILIGLCSMPLPFMMMFNPLVIYYGIQLFYLLLWSVL